MRFIIAWFVGITCLIFLPFFLHGDYPISTNFLIAWYEPWKSQVNDENISISHKAVADDVFRQIYPFKKLASELFKTWQWPLWNPYNGSGQPLLATLHPGFLNPISLVMIFFPNAFGWSLFVVIQPLLLSLFMYIYLRQISLSKISAIFGSTVLTLSGITTIRYVYGDYIYALTCLPVLLSLFEVFMKRKSRLIVLVPVVVALLSVSVQPQITLYILGLFLAYAFFRMRSTLGMIRVMTLVVIGVGLASVQLIPTLELYRSANITNESSKFIIDKFLLEPFNLIAMFIPNYFGNQGTYNFWGQTDYVETVNALGLLPIFFALISFSLTHKVTKSIAFFYIIIVIFTILLSYSWVGSKFLYALPIPILSTSIPARIFLITTFSISILSSIGFEVWIKNMKSKYLGLIIFMYIAFILAMLILTGYYFVISQPCPNSIVNQCRLIAIRNFALETLVFTVFGILFILYGYWKKIIISWLIIGLVVLIGVYNSRKFIPFSDPSTVFPPHELIDAVKSIAGSYRVFGFGGANIKTNIATELRIYDPNYYDPLYIRRYGELVNFAKTGRISRDLSRSDIEITNDILVNQDESKRRDRLLDLVSIKYALYKKHELQGSSTLDSVWQNDIWEIYQRKTALPRAYIVYDYDVVSDNAKNLEQLFDQSFDVTKGVILEQDPGYTTIKPLSQGSAKFDSYSENKIVINALSETDGILVLTDNYFPGWKAYIDGMEVEILRANYTFRAVVIPKGEHLLLFEYRPASLKFGLMLSGFFFLLYIIIVWNVRFSLLPKANDTKSN